VAPRLKVFMTSDGLTDYVVAASSRPKALAAWGSHQDLFKTGLAHETDDPALTKAARARPGEVLKRPAGALDALARLKPASKPAKPKGPSKAALRKVADLEARIARAEAAHAEAIAVLEAERAALEVRREAEKVRLAEALSAAKRALG
jgi:hypothetical protein